MTLEIVAILVGIAGAATAAISLYALAGWPAVGLLIAAALFFIAGTLGTGPDKPL